MKRIVDKVTIKNFKSLRDVEIDGCRTYNLFLGYPNVGKSNILEAMSIFSLPYLKLVRKDIKSLLRLQNNTSELFHNGNVSEPISIVAGENKVSIEYNGISKYTWTIACEGQNEDASITISDGKLDTKKDTVYPIFKKYIFSELKRFVNIDMSFLLPVGGENLMKVIQQDKKLSNEINSLVDGYGLKLLLDTSTNEVRFLKDIDINTAFTTPFFSMSDTLQRLIFYKAAVTSNHDSVIMLEEIESHSFPPYISKVTNTILDDKNNQYFITTHSPYVVNDFLERMDEDIAIYIVDYDREQGQTVVKRLTDNELQMVYDAGIDLFFNTEMFLEK